ncbi:MAG: hypothetical protein R3E46_08025 [Sedimenticolaceae bacterium]
MKISHNDLIEWANSLHSKRDPDFIEKWLALEKNPIGAVDALAIFLAKSFVDGAVSFDTASTLLNQTMPVIGFETASQRFWQIYTALEDFELVENPGAEARMRVRSVLELENEI